VFVLKMVFGFGGKKKEKKEARPASVAESVNPEVIPLAPSELPVIPAIKPDSAKKSTKKPNSAKTPISTPNSAKPKSKSVVVKKTKEIPEKNQTIYAR